MIYFCWSAASNLFISKYVPQNCAYWRVRKSCPSFMLYITDKLATHFSPGVIAYNFGVGLRWNVIWPDHLKIGNSESKHKRADDISPAQDSSECEVLWSVCGCAHSALTVVILLMMNDFLLKLKLFTTFWTAANISSLVCKNSTPI